MFIKIVSLVIILMCKQTFSQFSTGRTLTQSEKLKLQMQNQINGRSVATPVFTMTQGYINPNGSFLAFQNETLNLNGVTFKSLGAMRAATPGLYMFTATVASALNGTTVVQMRKESKVLATIESRNGIQTSATAFDLLNVGQAAYLQVVSGQIRENSNPDGALNSFSGVLLVAAIQNNFGNFIFPQQ